MQSGCGAVRLQVPTEPSRYDSGDCLPARAGFQNVVEVLLIHHTECVQNLILELSGEDVAERPEEAAFR